MNDEQTKQAAAARILEKGVSIKVSAPLFFRLLGKKHFSITIRPTRLGTQMAIADKLLSIEADWDKLTAGDLDEALRLKMNYGKLIARVAAIAILDSWWAIPLFSRPLGAYLLWHLPQRSFTELLLVMQMLNSPADFTDTIRLLRTATTTILDPRNLSPDEQGSQQATASDCIAPGEPSGA